MSVMSHSDDERRRKNILLAWAVAAFAILMFLSSIPFWKGLFEMAVGN
jgi:hypothetical protein